MFCSSMLILIHSLTTSQLKQMHNTIHNFIVDACVVSDQSHGISIHSRSAHCPQSSVVSTCVVREQIRLQPSRFPLTLSSLLFDTTQHQQLQTRMYNMHFILLSSSMHRIQLQCNTIATLLHHAGIHPFFLLSSFERDEKKEDQILFYYIFVQYQAHH